jgi:2-phospho-L-lactate guanylyltransferase (CobY/MobA/RfbA family)
VIHADLPLVSPPALQQVFDLARTNTVLVPSYNAGTNIVAGTGSAFRFSYGPGSFHRHLVDNPHAVVHTSPLLALDLDTEADLSRALALAPGSWLRSLVS